MGPTAFPRMLLGQMLRVGAAAVLLLVFEVVFAA